MVQCPVQDLGCPHMSALVTQPRRNVVTAEAYLLRCNGGVPRRVPLCGKIGTELE